MNVNPNSNKYPDLAYDEEEDTESKKLKIRYKREDRAYEQVWRGGYGSRYDQLPYEDDYYESKQNYEDDDVENTDQEGHRSYNRRNYGDNEKDNPVDLELLDDVGAWLRSLKLHKYIDNLSDLQWQNLIRLNDTDLLARGINVLGVRQKLLAVFKKVERQLHDISSITNDGLSDVGETPSPFVFLRKINTDLDESKLMHLFVNTEGIPNPKRILFLRWKYKIGSNGINLPTGFVFVEFESDSMAQKAIDVIDHNKTGDNHYQMFGIPSRIHLGVFQPVLNDTKGQFLSALNQPMVYWDNSIFATEFPEPTSSIESHQENFRRHNHLDDISIDYKKKKRKMNINRQTAMPIQFHIQKWHSVHNKIKADETSNQASFADPIRNCCVLCNRKFLSTHELNAHERRSELHIYNLSILSRVERAQNIMNHLHALNK